MNRNIFASLLIFASLFLCNCGSTKVSDSSVSASAPSKEKIVVDDAEYKRSINELEAGVVVSKEEFIEDKTEIKRIISELQKIMDKEEYESWLNYISPASIKYYSSPVNIMKVQKKLPDKTIQLHGLKDYFKYIFIPARKRSEVNEIRYISKKEVKAVQVLKSGDTVVYYNFTKENGKWLVKIPTL